MSVHFRSKGLKTIRPSNEADRAVIDLYVPPDAEEIARRKAEADRHATAERLKALAETTFASIGRRAPCPESRYTALAAGSPEAVKALEEWLRWANCRPADYVKAFERLASRPCQAVPGAVYQNERVLGR